MAVLFAQSLGAIDGKRHCELDAQTLYQYIMNKRLEFSGIRDDFGIEIDTLERGFCIKEIL